MTTSLYKKLVAAMMLLFFLSYGASNAFAQSTFGGGNGTYADPYIISTTDHLDQLAADVNGGNWYNGKFFSLQADLDYAGKTYTPIGRYPKGFSGEFFGNNHSINNVTVVGDGTDIGIFGCLRNQAKVTDLTLGGNSRLEGRGSVGGIAGYIEDNKEICRCHVGADVVIAARDNPISDISGFGGIVGNANGDFTIRNCTSRATLTNSGIGRCTGMGGIIGTTATADEGMIEDCTSFSPIDCANNVGGIVGWIYSGTPTVQRCFYTNFFGGGIQGHDTDGAKRMGTVTFGENVSGTLPYATFWDGDTPYFGAGRDMVMAMYYTTEAGYVPVNVEYFANGNIPLTLDANGKYRFTMPDDDVTITGNATLKRDIGYSDWVSITIPEQDYTGEPLTPVVTVVDNKDGAALTLEEGTHYTVTLPDGGCVIPGYHNITITGMGDFGGQTTKTFTIFNPGSGTQGDPYIIRNTDQMDGLAASVNGGDSKSGKFFRLEADLDYTGKTYTRIGYGGAPFSGTFDGNGHTISHVTLNERSTFMGLFGYSNGTVKNLTLDHSSIHAEGGSVGGIVGCCYGGTVTGCYVTENVSISATEVDTGTGLIFGGDGVGGIVGTADHCTVRNCMNFAEVSGVEYVGGVVGRDENSIVTNNYYAGNCTVGGIGVSGSNSGSDAPREAQRGYAIEVQHPLSISLRVSLIERIGVFYDGKVYAGNGQRVWVSFEIPNSSVTPQCYTLSAGTIVDNGNGTYTITMPAEDITVSGNIVEIDGMFYAISCDGSNTATVVGHPSYATLPAVMIDESITVTETDYYVTAIADGAFDGCEHLKWFDCHANLLSIGDHAFRNCDSLVYLGLYQTHTPPTLGEGVFEGLGLDTLRLIVPYCSQYDYSQHEVFGQFGEIFGSGPCEYNFYNATGDNQWDNPANWQDANHEPCTEAPGVGARVGIFDDCEIDTDVTVGSVTIGYYIDEYYGLYERLTVKDGATLTATDFIYTTGDARNFVIEDGAQVIHPNAGAQATVEKNITAYTPNSKNGWHLVSSPAIEGFAPSADNGFLANEYDLYFYEEPTHHWRNHKPNGQYANFNIDPLKGYLYANSANDTLQLQGTLRTATETVNFPLSYTDGIALAGFNLVGNPFVHKVTAFTGSNIADEVYRMNGAKDNLMVSVIDGNNPLKPGEGFFVKATGDNASITFNSRANNAERSLSLSKGRITLEVSENGLIIDRFILKRDGAPLEKFTLNENSTRIFATEGAQDWAVAVIASEAKQIEDSTLSQSSRTEHPVNFKAAKNGTYTLTVNVENMDLDYLHLIDNMTGADVDLLRHETFIAGEDPQSPTPMYTFTAKATDYASRFRLVFSNCGDAIGDNAPFAYISNGEIRLLVETCHGASLQVVDLMGRVLVCRDALNTSAISTTGIPAGVYVLRLIDGDSVKTQKIFID